MAYQPKSYRKFIAGTMTAAMAASAFAVTTPQQVADAQEQTFSDVNPGDTHYVNVERAAERGVITGYSDGTYRPNVSITRGQIATMIVRAFDLEVPENPTRLYDDVSENHHFADVVQAVSEAGIMVGRFDNTVFEPGAPLSRQQMASILVRAFELENIPGDDTVPNDIDSAYEAHVENIIVLAQHGITTTTDGNFRPSGHVTRAQLSSFLERSIEVKHTIDSGLVDLQAINNTTVDVYFEDTVVDVDAEDFAFTGLDVVDAEVVAGPEGENNVVRLTTASQEEGAEYKLLFQGEYTSLTFEGTAAEATTPVEVTSVEALTTEGVAVEFEAPGEELVDATLVVTSPNGTTHEVVAQDIDADQTEATFEFATTLPYVHAGTWTVNGVEYTVDFTVDEVAALDRLGHSYEISFNAVVDNFNQSNIVVRDSITGERRGVQSVDLHDNGRTATVTFLDNAYLEAHRDYTFVIDIPGYASAESTHQRPEYLEDARIVGYNDNGTVVVRGYHPTSDSERVAVQENLDLGDVNLEGVLGQSGVFAYLRNNTVENFYQNDSETTVLGAVTGVNYNSAGTTPVSIEMSNGETYRLASGFIPRYNGTVDQSLTTTGDAADYAKVTLNSNNQVVFYDAYDWNRQSLLVESVDGNIVSGFGDQFNLTDYTVVESGQEIGISDISRGDNIYFNTTVEYAEVYNELAVGMIDRIFEDRVIVEGNEYQLTSDSAYIDAEGNRQSLQATHLQQFVDSEEPVSLYLDRSGNVSFVLGDLGDFVVGEDAAYLTSTVNAYRQGQRSNIELNYRNVTGSSESITLGLEQLTRINGQVKGRPFIDASGEEQAVIDYFTFAESDPGEGDIVAVLTDESAEIVVENVENLGNKDIIDFVKNNDGDIVGFNTLLSGTYSESSLQDAAEVGASYLEGVITNDESADIRVFGSTPVFLHDEDDNFVGVASWDDVEAFDFDLVTGATVYHGNNNPEGIADYLVINVDEDTDLDTETVETNAVVNSVSYNAAGDEITQISLIVDGQFVTYEVNLSDEQNAALTGEGDRLVRGEAVDVEVNSNGVVISIEELGANEVGTVSSVSTVDRTVTLTDGGTYRFDQNTYIVDNRSGNTPEFLTLTDLENLEDASVLVYTVSSGTNFVDFIVVNSGAPAPAPTITVGSADVDGSSVDVTANFADFEGVDSDNVTVAFELNDADVTSSFTSEEDDAYSEGVYTESFTLDSEFESGTHDFDVTVSYDGIDSEEFSFTISVEDEETSENN